MNADNTIKPRRTLVFVPGSILGKRSDPLKKFAADSLAGKNKPRYIPDSLIFDLEDSVPGNFKKESIKWIEDFLGKNENKTGVELLLRVNGKSGQEYYEDEFNLAREVNFDGVILPKVDRVNFPALFEKTRSTGRYIIPIIETARGYRDKETILDFAEQAVGLNDRVEKKFSEIIPAVIMGLDDFSSDMRIPRDSFFEEPGYSFFLTGITHLARSYDLAAIGPVFNRPKDITRLISENRRLRGMGYPGSLCVFPFHVKYLKEIYTPSPAEVNRAAAILDELHEASLSGKGWAFYQGVKFDTADKSQFEWLLNYAGVCENFDSRLENLGV